MRDCERDCEVHTKGLEFKDPSLVRCEFAEECSLRNIVRRFLRTGQLPQSRNASGITDATRLPDDFQSVMTARASAEQAFEQLPAEERSKYASFDAWLDAKAEENYKRSLEPVEEKPVEEKPVESSAEVQS